MRFKRGLRFFFLTTCFLFSFLYKEVSASHQASDLSSNLALAIGIKIWQNESGAKISGLTEWNKGENFASFGIGHFIWYPKGRRNSQSDEFPKLIRYMQKRGAFVPSWLNQRIIPPCPWHSREEFMRAKASNGDPYMRNLQLFLAHSITIQVQFMFDHLHDILPSLLAQLPKREHEIIYQELLQLMQTRGGIYALVDYLNFKGLGTYHVKKGRLQNAGLKQVLKEMINAPKHLTPVEAFSWSAQKLLIRKTFYAPLGAYEEKWLAGWLKRVRGYTQF